MVLKSRSERGSGQKVQVVCACAVGLKSAQRGAECPAEQVCDRLCAARRVPTAFKQRMPNTYRLVLEFVEEERNADSITKMGPRAHRTERARERTSGLLNPDSNGDSGEMS